MNQELTPTKGQDLIKQYPELKTSILKLESVKDQLDTLAKNCLLIKVTDESTNSVAEQNLANINSILKTVEELRVEGKAPHLAKANAYDIVNKYVTELSKKALLHLKDEKTAYVIRVEAEKKRLESLSTKLEDLKTYLKDKLEGVGSPADCEFMVRYIDSKLPLQHSVWHEQLDNANKVVESYKELFNLKLDSFESPVGKDLFEAMEAEKKQEEAVKAVEETVAKQVIQPTISKVRRTWTYELVDINKVPLSMLKLDEKLVDAYLAANKEILVDGGIVNGIKFYKAISVTA